MENMVSRSDDGYIFMNVACPVKDRHRIFNKELSAKYLYQYNSNKASFYLFNFFEAICFQCGFFTWEDIRKFMMIFFYFILANLLFLKIEIYSFNQLVTVKQEVLIMSTLYLAHGKKNITKL